MSGSIAAFFRQPLLNTWEEVRLKKGQIMEGLLEKVDFPNKGIVQTEEGSVVVKNAIPGQKVRFRINKKRKNRAEGQLLEVLEKSPLEIREPQCSIFPACGGCMYQTMGYEEQLKMKESQVRKLLDEAIAAAGQTDENGAADYSFEGIRPSPKEFTYRNKMEFSFGDACKDGELELGLHKKGSTYDVLTASNCKLVHPDMNLITSCVLEYFRSIGAPHYHKMSHTRLSAPPAAAPLRDDRRDTDQSRHNKPGRVRSAAACAPAAPPGGRRKTSGQDRRDPASHQRFGC